MKNLKIWSLALMLLVALTGCQEKEGVDTFVPGNINQSVNEWQLVEEAGQAVTFDVYVDFNEDNTFDMYERSFSYEYVYRNGNYTVSGNQLTGTYSDGSDWNNSYRAEVSADGKTLRLHTTDGTMSVYVQKAIPEFVKESAIEASASRANGYFL